jgi:hypothetical protein
MKCPPIADDEDGFHTWRVSVNVTLAFVDSGKVAVLQRGDFAGGQHLITTKQNVIKHYITPRTWKDVWHDQSNGQQTYTWENTSMFGFRKRQGNS